MNESWRLSFKITCKTHIVDSHYLLTIYYILTVKLFWKLKRQKYLLYEPL